MIEKERPAVSDTHLMPDRLSEAMVATASGYFLSGGVNGAVENPQDFRRTMRNVCRTYGQDHGRAVIAAGLMAAGFGIELEPLEVTTPECSPEASLTDRVFMMNYYLVAPTIIDMGIEAVSSDGPMYDRIIKDRAVRILEISGAAIAFTA
ncbi:MAG: hypothetical protein ACREJM_11785 [Candidatus Saccharimonadales bacterium]